MIKVRNEKTNDKRETPLTFHFSPYLPSSLLQYSSEPSLKRKGILVAFSTCSSFLQKKPKQSV